MSSCAGGQVMLSAEWFLPPSTAFPHQAVTSGDVETTGPFLLGSAEAPGLSPGEVGGGGHRAGLGESVAP